MILIHSVVRAIHLKRLVICFVAFLICVLAPAGTAGAESVRAGETAGAQASRYREERELEKKARAVEEAASSEAIEEKKPVPPTAATGAKFLVKDVRFLGNHSIPSSELEPFVASLRNRDVTLGEIETAVSQIKKHYRAQGYVGAYAYVPPQQMREGVLKIDVLEGRLGEVKIGPTKFFGADALQERFRVKPGDVLTHESLRRDIARLNKHPDIQASAVLEPGKTTGAADVAIEVKEEFPFHLTGSVNNTGTKNTGKERYGVNASHTNVTGHLDELGANVQWGEHSTAVGGSYSLPVFPKHGTKVGYSAAYAEVEIAGNFAPLQAEGDAFTQSAYISQPVYESRHLDASVQIGLDVKDIENRLLGFTSGRDKLSILKGAIELEQSDGGGKTIILNSAHLGLENFLGSGPEVDPLASRLGTGSEFFIYRGLFLRFQSLFDDWLASLKIAGQLTGDSLAPSEQFRLGGARSVRGYPEGEYLADYGVTASVDVYVPLFFIPEGLKVPFREDSIASKIQLIGFADVGSGILNEPQSGEFKRKNLAGIGTGMRIHLYDQVYGRVEWGFPVGDRPFDKGNSAFYFSVSWEAI